MFERNVGREHVKEELLPGRILGGIRVLPSRERAASALPKPNFSQVQSLTWALVSGSPVSFVAPQRVTTSASHVLIRAQLITDDSSPVPGKVGTSQRSNQLWSCHHLIISPGQKLQMPPRESESWGLSEEAEFPVGCAKWQLFELKVTWGWIGVGWGGLGWFIVSAGALWPHSV